MALSLITPDSLNLAQDYAGMGFGGTGSANQLDDYEEGTCTLNINDGTNTVSFPTDSANYTKIGNQVTVGFDYFNFSISSLSGSLFLSGFPFTSSAARAGSYTTYMHIAGTSGGANTPVALYVNQPTTTFPLYLAVSSTAAISNLATTHLASSITIRGRVTYRTS